MSLVEAVLIVGIVVGIGVLAVIITLKLTSPAEGPSPEQKRMVASNFMRGAQLMGRYGRSKEDGDRKSMKTLTADGKPKSADAATKGPSREDLREAIRCFDAGLKEYPNDFSTRFLKAQALEELGDLTAALEELDWLLSQKATVKPNFFRRMAMAVGVLESRSVAPLGTKLLRRCEVDLVVFHIRKRKGRVLLKKRRVFDAMHEIKLASNILDKLAWDVELQEREERVNSRMKPAGQQPSAGKENKQGNLTPRGVSTPKKAAPAPGHDEEAQLLLDGSYASALDSASYSLEDSGQGGAKEAEFKVAYARAELDLLLARCFEEQGNKQEAARCLDEASRIGNAKTQVEAKLAILRLEAHTQNGNKTE